MKQLYFLASFLLLQSSFSQILYTNGPLSTGTVSKSGVTAPAGYTWSELQNDTGNLLESNGTIGYPAYINNEATINAIIGDDFVVPAGQIWNVQGFDFYIYQQGYTGTTIPIDLLAIEIYREIPFNPNNDVLVAGDLEYTNSDALNAANSSDALLYRIFNSSVPTASVVPDTNRKIWKVRANLPVQLISGSYKVYFRTHAINGNAVFVPTVTVVDKRTLPSWNAVKSQGLAYIGIYDTGSPTSAPDVLQDIPFAVIGTSISSLVNDFCFSATPITNYPATIVETNAMQATNIGGFNTICGIDGMNDGEWFSFTGNGGSITLSLSGVQAGYDPQISIYYGYCGSFTCAGTADNGGTGGEETITIPTTVLGGIYYINIGHFSGTNDFPEGNFTLNITSSLLPNDACNYAVPIDNFPYTFTRTNGSLATNNNGFINSCGDGMNDGEWYNFIGNGSDVTITLSNVGSSYDPQVGVYSGSSCNSLTCIGTTDVGYGGQGETLTVPATILGTEYYINIGNFSALNNNPEGNFTITIATNTLGTEIVESISKIKVYPNPVVDFINIESATTITKAIIYNLLGQEVLSINENTITTINASSLPSGTYLLKLNNETEEEMIKIFKN